ncbi:MAG: hypothetical protein M3003_08245 [Candidatus Dormibacteraeota bacterium]|nr:hypothetical protein [Candidatus Dormibacteraeota bacterium]
MTSTDWFQLIGITLAFLSLIAAVVATKFAADSAKAASETVEPLQAMAASLKESVVASEKVLAAMRALVTGAEATAASMRALVTRAEATADLARLNRQADELVRRIGIYQRVAEAVEHMLRGQREFVERKGIGFPDEYRERARADLKGALSLLAPDDLQTARTLAEDYLDVWGALTPVDNDLPGRIRRAHEELEAVEKQIAKREATP